LKKIIDKIRNSKDAKSLLGNFVSLSAINLVSLIIPFFTLPYVLRIIGLEKYGLIALASSLMAYFVTLVDYSFNITATRDVAKHKNSYKQLCLIYSKVLSVKIFFMILSFIAITIIIFLNERFYAEWQIYLLITTQLLSNVLFPQWFFQGMEHMKFIAIIKVSIQLLFAASIFIFIKEETDFLLYVILLVSSKILSGLIGQIILWRKYKMKYHFISYHRFKRTLETNFPIFVNQFFPLLYNNTSTFLLGFFVSNEMVGIYAAIRKIIEISVTMLKTISNVFYPFLNRRHDAFKRYEKLLLTVSVMLIILLIVFHPLIFLFLNINWDGAFWLHTILSVSILGYVLYDIYGLNYLIVKTYDKAVMQNTIWMSIIGFCIAFPLIYYFGVIGAALTLLITRFLMGLGVFYVYKQKFSLAE
jgi:PST family polysaccharide transporter